MVRPSRPSGFLVSSSRVTYLPCAIEPPKRRPTIGVTPPPSSNTGVCFGLVTAPIAYGRVGEELTTAVRTSQWFAERVSSPPSGYVDDSGRSSGTVVSNGGIGTR